VSKTIKRTPPVKGHRRPGKVVKRITHHRVRREIVQISGEELDNYYRDCMAGHAAIYQPTK
jgi:hypothetical protein